MRDRLSRALALLQPAPLPVDLIDNPYRTDQWLITVYALHQAMLVLLGVTAEAAARPGPARPADSRADRVTRRFSRLVEGLPVTCLASLSPVIKLGLLWPLLADLEVRARRIAEHTGVDVGALESCLHQYRVATAAMAARHAAPEPPAPEIALRQPRSVASH